MPKKDIMAALVIGEVSSWLMLLIARNLEALPFGLDELASNWWLLPIVFPLLCAGGMVVALFFEKRLAILYQFAKFFLVGGLNFLVDLGLLNLFISLSGIAAGWSYSFFKAMSFLVANINSYFWNKHWTFGSKKGNFSQFFVVSIVGLFVNVGAASLVVNLVGPQFGLGSNVWANVGALTGSILGLVWNFLGYKFLVFKQNRL